MENISSSVSLKLHYFFHILVSILTLLRHHFLLDITIFFVAIFIIPNYFPWSVCLCYNELFNTVSLSNETTSWTVMREIKWNAGGDSVHWYWREGVTWSDICVIALKIKLHKYSRSTGNIKKEKLNITFVTSWDY